MRHEFVFIQTAVKMSHFTNAGYRHVKKRK
jgi:hypothetical protein